MLTATRQDVKLIYQEFARKSFYNSMYLIFLNIAGISALTILMSFSVLFTIMEWPGPYVTKN